VSLNLDGVITPERSSTIRLRDGRTLGYLEAGKVDGSVVLHCHGSGSSRLEALLLADTAEQLGIRLVSLDRPGIGKSDFHEYLNISAWVDDVVELADQLGLRRFAVQGISNGGPYALACAYRIPDRLTSCGLVSTVSPADIIRKTGPAWWRAMWWFGRRYPRAFGWYIRRMVPDTTPGTADIERQIRRLRRWTSEPDREVLQLKNVRACLARTLAEHRRQGGRGGRYEALVGMRAWGFDAKDISFGKTFLWHGEQDRLMPVVQARALASALPHCMATFYPDEGHFSLLVNRGREMLAKLCETEL
jgi:pimeloyl-ACP methyl ester carboxylesterase